ncbi:hypothetical protein HDA40_000178 [Hamadaea flava]|uniref:DUF4240 domain-containing protein n=1 Tax=Hamadaea flava TaxID=1742688 RepID=A0ABV8M0I5_9ACTN|nr:hypothetical protein [Hamadaea flava]MCP2321671.1 hypothetical protein [Hamadaea flava]
MAVLDQVRPLLADPLFWARYFYAHADGPGADRLGDLAGKVADAYESEDDDDLDEDDLDDDGLDDDLEDEDDDEEVGEFQYQLRFDVGDGYGLLLDFDVSLDSYNLAAYGPGRPEAELGWDDLAHWHPYALRWSELELICRALAAKDGELPQPGPALALLCRFAAVFEDDDVDSAVAAVEAAYASLRPAGWTGYWPRGADWLERSDFRGRRVTWHSDESGNRWGEQAEGAGRDFYSIRSARPEPGANGFPHDLLRTILTKAAAAV